MGETLTALESANRSVEYKLAECRKQWEEYLKSFANYTSALRINGKPLLPPVMSFERRREMRMLMQQASVAAMHRNIRKGTELISKVELIPYDIELAHSTDFSDDNLTATNDHDPISDSPSTLYHPATASGTVVTWLTSYPDHSKEMPSSMATLRNGSTVMAAGVGSDMRQLSSFSNIVLKPSGIDKAAPIHACPPVPAKQSTAAVLPNPRRRVAANYPTRNGYSLPTRPAFFPPVEVNQLKQTSLSGNSPQSTKEDENSKLCLLDRVVLNASGEESSPSISPTGGKIGARLTNRLFAHPLRIAEDAIQRGVSIAGSEVSTSWGQRPVSCREHSPLQSSTQNVHTGGLENGHGHSPVLETSLMLETITLTADTNLPSHLRSSASSTDTLACAASLCKENVAEAGTCLGEICCVRNARDEISASLKTPGLDSQSPPKLLRSNSYTLKNPSPALLNSRLAAFVEHKVQSNPVVAIIESSPCERPSDEKALPVNAVRENFVKTNGTHTSTESLKRSVQRRLDYNSSANIKDVSRDARGDNQPCGKQDHLLKYLRQLGSAESLTTLQFGLDIEEDDANEAKRHLVLLKSKYRERLSGQDVALASKRQPRPSTAFAAAADGDKRTYDKTEHRRPSTAVPIPQRSWSVAAISSSIDNEAVHRLLASQMPLKDVSLWLPSPASLGTSSSNLHDCPKGEEWSKEYNCQRGFCLLSARIKGYLTRRLMSTNKVVHLRKTVQECWQLLANFSRVRAPPLLAPRALNALDVSLQERVSAQLTAALNQVHELFFIVPVHRRMALIRQSRLLESERRMSEWMHARSAEKSKRRVSLVTAKVQERRKAKELPVNDTVRRGAALRPKSAVSPRRSAAGSLKGSAITSGRITKDHLRRTPVRRSAEGLRRKADTYGQLNLSRDDSTNVTLR